MVKVESLEGDSFREAEWLTILAAHDIPAAPVQTLEDFRRDPALRHHGLLREYDHPVVGHLTLMGGLVFGGTPPTDPGPPPLLGQHPDEILLELGVTPAEIDDLASRGVIRRSGAA